MFVISCFPQETVILGNFSNNIESKQDGIIITPGGESLTLKPTLPNDAFEGQVINEKKWNANTWNGAAVRQNEKMIIEFPGTTSGPGCEITTRYEFKGDFDVQINWEILEGWINPTAENIDGAGMGIVLDGDRYLMFKQRYSSGYENMLLYSFQSGILKQIENHASSGIFRITRTGIVSRYYFDTGNGWELLHEVSISRSDAVVYLYAAMGAINHKLKSCFDDYIINQGTTNFRSEAGALLLARGLRSSAILDSITIDAVIPQNTEIEMNLFGKETFLQEWTMLGKYAFKGNRKTFKIDNPSFVDSVKFGLHSIFGIILTSQKSDSMPILDKIVLRTALNAGIPTVTVTEPVPNSTEKWDIYELTIQNFDHYTNPFWDVLIKGVFFGPDDEKIAVEGFYYDTNTWKLRFSPTAEGTWIYKLIFSKSDGLFMKDGRFQCLSSQKNNHGFIHIDKTNPFKFISSDSLPFIPVGINGHTPPITASFLGFHTDVPKMFQYLSSMKLNTYRLHMFHQKSFSTSFDWNPGEGCCNLLSNSGGLDRYNLDNGKLVDRWMTETKTLNIYWYLCLMSIFDIEAYPFSESFWSTSQGGMFPDLNSVYSTGYPEGLAFEKKYFRYVVNRYAAFRNILMWEYNNELGAYTAADWLKEIDGVIDQSDPYQRPHTVSFWSNEYSRNSDLNDSPAIDVTDDHSYQGVYHNNRFTQFNVDSLIHEEVLVRSHKYQKPVMYGEFGGGEHCIDAYWHDYERLGYWSAFVGGANTLKWLSGYNTSEEIAYNIKTIEWLSCFNKITENIQNYSSMVSRDSLLELSDSTEIRAYCLASQTEYVVYLHHHTDHSNAIRNRWVSILLPHFLNYDAQWFDPATAEKINQETGIIENRKVTFQIPEFTIDLILYLRISGALATGSSQCDAMNPNQFELYQNYPNPFNAETHILYSVQKRTRIKIAVLNMIGREIESLLDEIKEPGQYQINWNSAKSGASSGIFLIKFETDNYKQIIKTVLIK
jgi:hypothetical protein